ncbi:sialic acid-binding Ig-like lectin 7 isoform X3 [Paramisgurnus dabryanus]|uniref:sialic acid-binding Ig-like lectin 7 isoform X3 n=1 Tax=Paramisgurnus dabryanus TaxID=90735 RepID=UPI0031F34FE5
MHIISSCIILFMMILNILCQGELNNDWNISFTPPEETAVSGLCAHISCSFSYPNGAVPKNLLLCKASNQCKEAQAVKKTKYKMLETDLNKKNCSIIINNIKAEDEREYKIRVEGDQSYTYNRRFKIIIEEGEQANLSCSVPFPCPETPPEITWWIEKERETFTELKENITLTTSKSFILSTLTFMPTSELHKATVTCEAKYKDIKTIKNSFTIEVMYVTLRILGNDEVNEGDTLSLNCTVDSHPPSSHPVWSFNGNTEKLKNHISAESLTITNVSKLHAGEYVCEVTYRNETLTKSLNINVIQKHGTIGPDTDGQNRTGKTIDPQNVTGNITGVDNRSQNQSAGIQDFFKNLELSTILTFLAGMATSAVIFSVALCCWVSYNRSKKTEVLAAPPDSAAHLETVQTNIDSAVTGEQTNEETPLQNQFALEMSSTQVEMTGPAEDSEAGGADGDVDYATIDYSLLKKKTPEEKVEEIANTDYAEIKRVTKGRKAPQNQDDQVEMSNEGSENQKQNECEEELYSNSQAVKGLA